MILVLMKLVVIIGSMEKITWTNGTGIVRELFILENTAFPWATRGSTTVWTVPPKAGRGAAMLITLSAHGPARATLAR